MSDERTEGRGSRVMRWAFAVFLLALAGWMIPGSLWGTSPDGLLPVWLGLVIGIAFLIGGLILLWAAIRERATR